jgi:hypothetical protein
MTPIFFSPLDPRVHVILYFPGLRETFDQCSENNQFDPSAFILGPRSSVHQAAIQRDDGKWERDWERVNLRDAASQIW